MSCFGSPPSYATTYTCRVPEYSPENAIHFPSGEIRGYSSYPSSKLVTRCARPPSAEQVQMSPA